MTGLPLAESTLDLARIQFGMTSIYDFLFVPLTLGLAPALAGQKAEAEMWCAT